MRADVRIRIRGGVIRVRIGETRIRTVIRITAEQKPTRTTNLYQLFKPISVTVTTHRYQSWELIHFPKFLTDLQNIL